MENPLYGNVTGILGEKDFATTFANAIRTIFTANPPLGDMPPYASIMLYHELEHHEVLRRIDKLFPAVGAIFGPEAKEKGRHFDDLCFVVNDKESKKSVFVNLKNAKVIRAGQWEITNMINLILFYENLETR